MVEGVIGVVSLAGDPLDAKVSGQLERLAGSNRASSRIVRQNSSCFVALGAAPTVRKAAGAEAFSQPSMAFAADARLTNRDELGALLSLSLAQLEACSDCALLMRLYLRSESVAHALGSFAFAAWQESERRLVLGRDCLGERALFYHVGDGFVAFATELNALFALPIVPRALDEEAVANLLVYNPRRAIQTIYRGIERVPSRTLVTIDRSGVRRAHYWTPDFDAPPPYKRDEDYVLRARELFDQAVLRATTDTPHVAISLSGGLDSSAVAATAARLGRAQSIRCYTVVPPHDTVLDIDDHYYLSERDKVEALARIYPRLDIEFCEETALHPFEDDASRFFARAGLPAKNVTTLGMFGFLHDRVRDAGHRAMLTGARGNMGLTWRGSYSLLASLRQNKIGAFIRDFHALSVKTGLGAFRTFARDILIPAVPPSLRRILHRVRSRDPYDVSRFSCLNPAIIRDLDLPRAWREEGFDPWSQFSGWDSARLRAHFLFDRNQYARDFRALGPSIDGFESRDPHADRTLLEFLLRVPEPLYCRNGVARSFAREVFADRLPPEIINETRRGYQGATWFHRMDIRRAEIAEQVERLAASPLASRLLDLPRVKQILDDWPKDAQAAESRIHEVRHAFARGVHVGSFIRWVEGGNG